MKHFNYINGNFRICQLTDIHLEHGVDMDLYENTFKAIESVLDTAKPDLIIITGDISWGHGGSEQGLIELAEFFERKEVLWAPVFGNHDGNAPDSEIKTREAFADILCRFRPNCLFEKEIGGVDGFGNYIITIGDKTKPEWALYMLDSHQGRFYPSQIKWYDDTRKTFSEEHKELAFFHVPLPEYKEVWDYRECKGQNNEGVCHTEFNDGLFAVMARGRNMKGIFVGHDHINDYEGELHGIRLCYGRGIGYQCYGLEGYEKGARIIDLTEGADNFETSIVLENGNMYKQTTIHKPKLQYK